MDKGKNMPAFRKLIICSLVSFSLGICTAAFAEDEDWGIEEDSSAEEVQVDDSETEDSEDTKSESSGSIFDKFIKAAGSALGEKVEEEIDRVSGSYEGKITDIVLVERLGNKLVFDARYKGIKRSDGVSIAKEVMYQGEVLESFNSSATPVRGKGGKVRLAIKFKGESEDDGWGIEGEDKASDEIYSDQIRLSLVRDKNPDKPFGSLAFDIDKLWVDSDEPDQPFAEDEEMELEGDSEQGGTIKPMPGVFIKPGVVIKPAPLKAGTASVANTKVQSPKASATGKTQKVPARPIKVRPKNVIAVTQRFDIYENANKMQWSTGKGNIQKIADGPKERGYIKKIARGKLSTGNKASKLIYAHPAPRRDGYSQGILSNVKLVKKTRFKSAVGFVGNNTKSDGAIFSVFLVDSNNKRIGRKFRKRVNPNKYEYIDFDLSRYKGKVVSIVMRIDGGANSAHDSSVWIAPRLEVEK